MMNACLPEFGEDALCWAMPVWMEPYRHLIGDTGEQSVEELMNDCTSGFHNNYMRAARIMAVNAQIELLERLNSQGVLLPMRVEHVSGLNS
jgi:hypothetical protein